MDRRSWLWRRKSSEKSPGETESSGSLSSQSERFSDDQACSNHHIQSSEVTSRASPNNEELDDSVKKLTEKLSAALLNIRAKEDLVKQHTKVTEEAVSGWEKAESEVLALKQQLEVATQKTSLLEDRAGNLDGALKECVRQLRQTREEQDQRVQEAVARKTHEWEFTKSGLESQLIELQSQLETTRAKSFTSIDRDLCSKLDAAERENSALKLELLSRAEELEIRIIERDLSTQTAETASKQHLESIKKVAKLETECRRLKAVARKALPANDYRSVTASSIYVESFTDSQSDCGERQLLVETERRLVNGLQPTECEPIHSNSWASALMVELVQFNHEKDLNRNLMVPSVEINLMDDFLEMEKLAALPETESGSCCPESGALSDQYHDGESPVKTGLDAMINRTAELEEKLEKLDMKKAELEMALGESHNQVRTLKDRLVEEGVKLAECQTLLSRANEARIATEAELVAANTKRELAESNLVAIEAKNKALLSKIGYLEEEVRKEQAMSGEAERQRREDEVKLVELQAQLYMENEARSATQAELEATNVKRELAESTLVVVETQIKTLLSKVGCLEEEIQKERAVSEEAVLKCQKMEDEILRMKREVEMRNAASLNGVLKIKQNGDLKITQDKELAVAASKLAECQKTIASLGHQLKSLATLEDFLIDSEKTLEVPKHSRSQFPEEGPESLYSTVKDSEAQKKIIGRACPLENG